MSNTFLYVIAVFIWGSTWLGIEFQLGVVPPEVSVFYRYVLAAVILFAWSFSRGLNMSFNAEAHARFVLLGLLLFCLNYILAYHAQRYVVSALIAIAFSMMVWMNILNARIFFGVRSGPRILLGALMGIAGICLTFWPSISDLSLSDATVFGASLGMLGAYIASLGNMVSQSAQRMKLPIIQSNAWGMFYGALFTGAIAAGQGREFVFDWSIGYVVSLLYLAVFGSVIAFGAYLQLLGRIGAHKVGYATVLFPIVALILSVLFEDLEMTAPIIIGMCLVLLGNYFVMSRVGSRRPPAARE